MVQELIRRLFEVDLTEQSVGRLLRRLGMSPQRPVTRAYEQDSGAVRHWKTVTFPKIKAEAVLDGRWVALDAPMDVKRREQDPLLTGRLVGELDRPPARCSA